MLHLQFDVPKGQSQISPGQHPGNTFSSQSRALTGRNRIRFFTGDYDVAIAETCGALTGQRFLGIAGPRALPWAGMSFPFGAEFGIAQHENAPARGVPFPARTRPAPYRPDAPVLMLRRQFDVPKGQSQISPGQRPGNTFSSQSRALTERNRIRFFTGD